MKQPRGFGIAVLISATQLIASGPSMAAAPEIPRDFVFSLPLFAGPWLDDASGASVLTGSDQQILTLYKVLCGDDSDLVGTGALVFPYPDVAYEDWTIPIFRAGAGEQDVTICDYDGWQWQPNAKWGIATVGGPVTVPACSDSVRPSDPVGLDADGHLVLYDPTTSTEYDFWQATTVRSQPCGSLGSGYLGASILEAGYADFFDVTGDGSNPPGVYSARAMGTALLAGMILPEDIESGSIDHALALGILGPRNLSPDPGSPLLSDILYPAATTESDYYSTNPRALAAGQRLRAKSTLVDDTGTIIDEENDLAPITRMFLAALRTYGAYVVDNAGGLSFYAEDIHTANLALTDDEVNALIGQPPGTAIPPGSTKWQLLMETLNDDLWNNPIPIAYGNCSGAASTVTTPNFEVISPFSKPSAIFADDFESGDGSAWSAQVP